MWLGPCQSHDLARAVIADVKLIRLVGTEGGYLPRPFCDDGVFHGFAIFGFQCKKTAAHIVAENVFAFKRRNRLAAVHKSARNGMLAIRLRQVDHGVNQALFAAITLGIVAVDTFF